MARFYADEDFDFQIVIELRRRGHDLLTVQEAGQGNQMVEDAQVVAFANAEGRIVLTFNRRDFINLHRSGANHQGIIACTRDADTVALADRIEQAVGTSPDLRGQLLRINRPKEPECSAVYNPSQWGSTIVSKRNRIMSFGEGPYCRSRFVATLEAGTPASFDVLTNEIRGLGLEHAAGEEADLSRNRLSSCPSSAWFLRGPRRSFFAFESEGESP